MRIIASRGQRNWRDKIEGKYVEGESEEADLAENNNKGKKKKTQQNKQKHNKNVERGSEEVDMAKKYNKTKQEKRAKMLKERVKR